MRLRIQRKVRKALRIFGIRGVDPAGLPALVRNRSADSRLRALAARLLAFDKRQRDPFGPLYAQMLDGDAGAAMDLANALHLEERSRPRAEVDALGALLRSSPEETMRIAVVLILGGIRGRASRRILLETMERESESLHVRTTVADGLSYRRPRRETVEALLRCLRHPNPEIRFWAVFGLGTSVTEHRGYHGVATAALRPLISDVGEARGFWSVGDEARAMLAQWDSAMHQEVQRECAAILTGPEENSAKWRWASGYGLMSPVEAESVPRAVTYHGIRWFPRAGG